jgi:hypothetical protein
MNAALMLDIPSDTKPADHKLKHLSWKLTQPHYWCPFYRVSEQESFIAYQSLHLLEQPVSAATLRDTIKETTSAIKYILFYQFVH